MARRIKNNDFGVVAFDSFGHAIEIGTFIHFHWVTNTPFGEMEDDIQGLRSHGVETEEEFVG